MVMKQIVENMEFNFNPELEVQESKTDDGWLNLKGTALVEGISKNRNKYTIKNLKENDGKKFKWIFGHPYEAEKHIVGLGKFSLQGGKLRHEGKIRNTSEHSDVVEAVQDRFLGPSIHATAKKTVYNDEKKIYELEGLEIDGVGLVAFQGVKQATIENAIAESFKERTEKTESSEGDETKKDMEGINMPEDETKEKTESEEESEKTSGEETETKETPEEKEETPEETPKESVSVKDFKAVREELNVLKESQKKKIVGTILEHNKELKESDLMKESEDTLRMRLEYESKLNSKESESSVVEDSEGEKNIVMEAKDGSATLTSEAYETYNKELRDLVR